MKSNILSKKLKAVLSAKKLNKLGLEIGFAKRLRDIVPFELVSSVIAALGDKDIRHFSEIQRYFNQLTGKQVKYKPFYNQLAKPEFATMMQSVTEKVLNYWVNTQLNISHDVLSRFEEILLQDGSSFGLNEHLQEAYPGRFTATSPAAAELHVTYNLTHGTIEKSVLTPDSYSERAELPEAGTLKSKLLLADRGYYSGKLLSDIDEHGGSYLLRAMRLSRIPVYQAIREDGKVVYKNDEGKALSEIIKTQKHRQMIDMQVEIDQKITRLVAIYSPKEKRYTYLVTNLKATDFTVYEISQLYRLRWQIELLFKECKSYNNLQGYQTGSATLQEALIWGSLISMTLKRFISKSIELFYELEMSTMIVSKTTVHWWYSLLESIVSNNRSRLRKVLDRTYLFLKDNAVRANPKRDRITGIYQFGVEPSFLAENNGVTV